MKLLTFITITMVYTACSNQLGNNNDIKAAPARTKIYTVDSEPHPRAGEKVYDLSTIDDGITKIRMLACSQWAGVFVEAAEHEGLRLCYDKMGLKFIVDEWLPNFPPNGYSSGINIGKFMCKSGLETKGRLSNLKCIGKKFD